MHEEPESENGREDLRFVVRLRREVSSALGIASRKLRDLWNFIMLRLNRGGE